MKQIRQSRSVIECWEAGSWRQIKLHKCTIYSKSALAALLPTSMSKHIMDTTFNTFTRALNSLVTVASSRHLRLVLPAAHWSSSLSSFLSSFQHVSTPSVSTTPSLHKELCWIYSEQFTFEKKKKKKIKISYIGGHFPFKKSLAEEKKLWYIN